MSRSAQGVQIGRLLRQLIDEGFIDPVAALEGRLRVKDLSSSNPVGLIEAEGHPALVVKGAAQALDGTASVEAEVAVYRWLRESPATAALAPTPLLDAASGAALVVANLEGSIPLHEALACQPLARDRLVGALGRALGVLHARTSGSRDLPARRPWILSVPSGVLPVIAVGNPAAATLVDRIAESETLTTFISRLDRLWQPRTVIHGDIKFDNVLIASDEVHLIDWELAGLGEPAWDLAGVADGLLLPVCLSKDSPALDWNSIEALMQPALAAHRAVAGAGLVSSSELLQAAVVTRLAQTAIQMAAMSYERQEMEESASVLLHATTVLATESLRERTLIEA